MKNSTNTFYISKFTVVFFVICIFGGVFTVKGLISQQQRLHIKNVYDSSQIRAGDYIQYDIALNQLLGRYYEEMNRYSPVCITDAYTSESRYFVATGENKDDYISLIVPLPFQEELQQLIDGETKVYHIYGRIEKLKHQVYHDLIMEDLIYCTGVRDTTKLNQMVSTKYELKVMDANEKESMWYKGLLFFLMGIFGVFGSIEKKPFKAK